MRDVEIFTPIVSRHQPWGSRVQCQTEWEHVEKGSTCFQGRRKCVLLLLLAIADLNRKKCFGDGLNLWKVPYLCLRNIKNLGPCTSRCNKSESGFALNAQKSRAAHEHMNCPACRHPFSWGPKTGSARLCLCSLNQALCPSWHYSKKLMISSKDKSFTKSGYAKVRKYQN